MFDEGERPAVSTAGDPELKEYLVGMAQLAGRRALYLPEHAEAVTRLAQAVALDMKLGRPEAMAIGEAARLRDIVSCRFRTTSCARPGL